MKRFFIATVVGLVMAGSSLAADVVSALQVNGFVRTAERGQSAVVEGVVSLTWPDKDRMRLIDADEYRKCGDFKCAKFILPVIWKGEMPELGSTVLLTGRVNEEGRMKFVAESLKLLEGPTTEPRTKFRRGRIK